MACISARDGQGLTPRIVGQQGISALERKLDAETQSLRASF